jgi:hypothetical protein
MTAEALAATHPLTNPEAPDNPGRGCSGSAGRRHLLATLSLTLLMAGCGPFTFPLTLSPTPSVELPTTGRVVSVTVSDERLGDSSTWLGVVRSGNAVGDYVLQGGDSVALRMTRDVVAALRSQGYRASESGVPLQQPEDTFLQIRIVRLAATVYGAAFQTPKWQWSSAFVCRSGRRSSRELLWADFVYTSETRSISASSRRKEQEAFEVFYRGAVDHVVREFTSAVPP